MNIQSLTPNRYISRMDREEVMRRVQFFNGGSYRYTPSNKYISKFGEYLLKRKVDNLKEKFKH